MEEPTGGDILFRGESILGYDAKEDARDFDGGRPQPYRPAAGLPLPHPLHLYEGGLHAGRAAAPRGENKPFRGVPLRGGAAGSKRIGLTTDGLGNPRSPPSKR